MVLNWQASTQDIRRAVGFLHSHCQAPGREAEGDERGVGRVPPIADADRGGEGFQPVSERLARPRIKPGNNEGLRPSEDPGGKAKVVSVLDRSHSTRPVAHGVGE